MEVKSIDFSKKEFMANGKKYIISDKISINRYAQYQKILPQLTYGLSFDEIFKALRAAYDNLNKQKFADSSVIIHNLMNGISKVEETSRIHPALKIASMFINTESEDVKIYDEEIANKKIEDWMQEGYSMSDFFNLALSSIQGFREQYLEFTEANKTINESANLKT